MISRSHAQGDAILPMMTTLATPIELSRRPHFDNAAEWLHSLGDVPLERIIFDPLPGTATEADLLYLVDRDKLCELVDGTLVEKPVGNLEGNVAARLITYLTVWADANDAGAIGGADCTVRMKSGRVRLPDVSFTSRERLPGGRLPKEAIPSLAPDLAVEVLSETNTNAEMDQKRREYFQSGTRLEWIIDIRKRTVAVYHDAGDPVRILNESDTLDGEHVAPGFQLAIRNLFKNLPES